MSLVNYVGVSLRDSAATSGASEQDAAVTLPDSVTEIWVTVRKTAEANVDNLLTVRLQAQVNSVWFDLSYDDMSESSSLTSATDAVPFLTRTPNIADAHTGATFTRTAHFKSLPSRVLRTISISSGTGVANTFSAHAFYQYRSSRRGV